jgi:hypothetical protein
MSKANRSSKTSSGSGFDGEVATIAWEDLKDISSSTQDIVADISDAGGRTISLERRGQSKLLPAGVPLLTRRRKI